MYRHKMNSAPCSTNRLRSGAAERKLQEKESQQIRALPPGLTLPRSEQEEELRLPKRKIQLKENNASHLQFLGCDSEDWPLINGHPETIPKLRSQGNLTGSGANSCETPISSTGIAPKQVYENATHQDLTRCRTNRRNA